MKQKIKKKAIVKKPPIAAKKKPTSVPKQLDPPIHNTKRDESLIPTKQQNAWLSMVDRKNILVDHLEKDELYIQGLVADILKTKGSSVKHLEKIQSDLKECKDTAAKSKEERLHFTNMITEKLITPFMGYEKNNEAQIKLAVEHELEIRKDLNKAVNETNTKLSETNMFKAHVKSEYFRQAANYRFALDTHIITSYTHALKTKMRPGKELVAYVEECEKMLEEIELPAFNKFPLKYLDKKEAMAVFSEIPAYDPANDFNIARNRLQNKFLTYKQDMGNPFEAIKATALELDKRKKETDEEIDIEDSTNTLIAQGQQFSFEGAPKIKVKMEIEIEETFGWMIAVLTSCLRYSKDIQEYTKNVKNIENIKISQLASYLAAFWMDCPDERKPTFPNLKMRRIEK